MRLRRGIIAARLRGPLTGWFALRSRREQGLILILAGLLPVLALYALVWLPLGRHRDAASDRIARYEAALVRLDAPAAAGSVPAMPVAGNATSLTATVTESAKALALPIRRLEPGENSLGLTLDDANFDVLIGWLDDLSRESGIVAAAADIERRTEPGVVRATLTLRWRDG